MFRTRTRKERSLRQEKAAAKSFGGRVQPGSGAFDFHKGDVVLPFHLIECKTTQAKSFSVTVDLLRKIENEAFEQGKTPVLMVSFEKMPIGTPPGWVMVPAEEFKRLLQCQSKKNG